MGRLRLSDAGYLRAVEVFAGNLRHGCGTAATAAGDGVIRCDDLRPSNHLLNCGVTATIDVSEAGLLGVVAAGVTAGGFDSRRCCPGGVGEHLGYRMIRVFAAGLSHCFGR